MDELDWASVVRLVRRRHLLKQEALADLLGSNQSTISRWEKGATEPDTRSKRKILEMYTQPVLSPAMNVLKSQIQNSDCLVLVDQCAVFQEISETFCGYYKRDRSEVIGRSNAERMLDGGETLRHLCKSLVSEPEFISAKLVNGGYDRDGTLIYSKSDLVPIIGPDADFYIQLVNQVIPEEQYRDYCAEHGRNWQIFAAGGA